MSMVLVTGGSGFLAAWCIVQLLDAGHYVRTTVRSVEREATVFGMIENAGADPRAIEIVCANLDYDKGWAEAMANCDYVLHVASPFGGSAPADAHELIRQARDGTLRVLRAASDAGIRRAVLTSSFAAVGYGHPTRLEPFTEADWTDITQPDVHAYIRSKTEAERAAWSLMSGDGIDMELSVINPVGIFGPVLGPDFSSSIEIIRNLLRGSIPATPRMYFGMVDVRDVATLHLAAMTSPAAAGKRFLAVAGETVSMHDVAMILRSHLGTAARRVPRFELPDFAVRTLALFSPAMHQVVPQLGKKRRASSLKAQRELHWSPRSNEELVVATGESLLRLGLVAG